MWGDWALSRGGIYFRNSESGSASRHAIRYFDLATGRVADVREDEEPGGRFWLAVSPDEQWLLSSHSSPATSELVVVENFR
jgi:hypothetical protein